MKFSLMQQVYIQTDTFNFGAPVGETGYISKVDRDIDQAQPYCVRVPSKKEYWWLPECDLVSADDWLANEAETVVKSAIVDHALDTRDKQTFMCATSKRE